MFNLKEYYRQENECVEESYGAVIRKVREIVSEAGRECGNTEKAPFLKFFRSAGSFFLNISEYEKRLNASYFETSGFESLRTENSSLYEELQPGRYSHSYTDPAFAVAQLGDRYGQAFSCFYVRIRKAIQFAFRHKIFKLVELGTALIEVYRLVSDGPLKYEALLGAIIEDPRKPKVRDSVHELEENFSVDYGFLKDIVRESDLSDLRYLFRYGRCISEAEIATARFIMKYPEEKLLSLSKQIVRAYVTGFERDNKDMASKSTVRIFYTIGYEKVVRYLMEHMLEVGLKSVIGDIFSHKPNKQYEHDHKFDSALYLEDSYVDRAVSCFSEACEKVRPSLEAYSGTCLIESFGEEPFVPAKKRESLRFSAEHQRLFQVYQNRRTEVVEKYMPRTETSFTIIAFPSPEIGENFSNIFDDIYTVNMLDTEKYERIQQRIIDVLDKADYIHIKGRGSCETDISVKMHALDNPAKQTNFVNCGADVNIPLGEVFTSPLLEGTNGILHVKETFLKGFRYDNLKLTFRDGYISDYSCTNYDNDEDNRKYIEENLLFPHKSLPVGEFAIGTNTLAYAISKRYDILRLLPILIIEKMGPHFAIGDTCFRHEEDLPVYNALDGKEIIARENEKSALRKENPDKAYTYCHTDITIPYESIECIATVMKEDHRIDIVRDGKFVLEGTEELNVPLA